MDGQILSLVLGVIAGVVVWAVIVTVLNLGLRHGWSDYAAVEKAMAFALPLTIARLSISGISSLASGAVASAVCGERSKSALATASFYSFSSFRFTFRSGASFPSGTR